MRSAKQSSSSLTRSLVVPAAEPATTSRRFVVAADAAGQRLDVFLAQHVAEVSRSQLSRQIGEAAVTVNGAAGTPSRKLRPGDVVVWTPPPPVATEIEAEALPLTVVYED